MIKKVINVMLVVAIFSATSCKKKEEFQTYQVDSNNNLVPPGPFSNSMPHSNKNWKPEDYPIIKFDANEFDFGDIKQGEKVVHIFKFKNIGKNDLSVVSVRPSCGCTAPDWTKTPVKSGATGEIKIIFDTSRKFGKQNKSITLNTNTIIGNEVLKFTANIIGRDGKQLESPLKKNLKIN